MNINASLLGQFIIVFAVVMALLGYFLGRKKTETPFLTAIIAMFSALIPPVAIIFLVILVMKKDVRPAHL